MIIMQTEVIAAYPGGIAWFNYERICQCNSENRATEFDKPRGCVYALLSLHIFRVTEWDAIYVYRTGTGLAAKY